MKRFKGGLAAISVAALATLAASALASKPSEPAPEPAPEPTAEPTEIPRPDKLNIKKRSAADELLMRDWLRLSLLKNDDLPGLKQQPDYADAALRTRINDSYGLPAVMTMRDPLIAPPGWWSADEQGIKALTLGPTRHFTRPELTIEVPMLRLREVPYINGDSEFVRALNEVVRLWTLGRTEAALALREKLQKDKKSLPRGTLERTTVSIISGFLDLQAATELKMPLARYGPAQGSFWDSLGSTELSVYLTNIDNTVDDTIFKSALAEPAIFSEDGIYPPRLLPPKLSPRSMDMIRFVRTMSLPVLFNVASLSVKSKNWTRVYEASQKFEEIYAQLDKKFVTQKNQELNFTTPSGVKSAHPIMMWPRTPNQLKTIIQMLKVNAQFIAEDPLMALKESSKVILSSETPAFKTIGFAQTANIYDDLGYPNYARRFHAFAEAFADVEWYQHNPYFLIGGGENAFWAGDLTIAKKAFEKFLLAAGDKVYGPWARLRLAEIAHLSEGPEKASLLYEELNRRQEKHPAGLIARRRLFCITAGQTGPKVRYLEYQALKEQFGKMEEGEIEQIRACHLNGLVNDAGKMAGNSLKTLPDDAAIQLDLIEEFSKKFPHSSYLKFLEERKVTLQSALGPYMLSYKQCGDAINFFKANEAKIVALKKNSGKFLPMLKWSSDDEQRLLRCAALFASNEMLKTLAPEILKQKKIKSSRKLAANAKESSRNLLTRLVVEMTVSPNDKRAEALFSELRRSGQDDLWSHVRSLEKKQSHSLDDTDFWPQLASVRVMQWDLEQPDKNKKLLRRSMRLEVLRRPEQTLQRKELCDRFLLESSTLIRREWDSFVLAVPSERWLEILNSSESTSACAQQSAKEALRLAQSQPTLARDKHILWPWLKARGALKEQEAWLALGTRWAREGSVSKQELEELFKTLEKEADSPTVKQAAGAWLESNKPGGLW